MASYNKSIDQLIYSHAIKYNRLKNLIDYHYTNIPTPEYIDIYIDLNRIIKSLNSVTEVFDHAKFVSGIINLVGHYRNFFNKFYNLHTKIYIVYSEYNDYSNKKIYPNYSYYPSKKNTFVNNTIDIKPCMYLLKSVISFLNDIDLVSGYGSEVGLTIMDIISSNPPNISLVITKDIYNYQLAAMTNISILRPYKSSDDDKSYIINNTNAILWLLHDRKNKINKIENTLQISTISSCLIPLILACTRCPERNIYNSLTYPTAIKTIMSCIADSLITNTSVYDIEDIISKMNTKLKKPLDIYQTSIMYKAISLQYQYIIKGTNNYTGIINLYDPEKLKELNNSIFLDYPIILENF